MQPASTQKKQLLSCFSHIKKKNNKKKKTQKTILPHRHWESGKLIRFISEKRLDSDPLSFISFCKFFLLPHSLPTREASSNMELTPPQGLALGGVAQSFNHLLPPLLGCKTAQPKPRIVLVFMELWKRQFLLSYYLMVIKFFVKPSHQHSQR